MTFVDTLMSWLSGALSFIADAISKMFSFLAVPLGWLVALISGIWYFIQQLFFILVGVLDIVVALFQFLGALVLGFMRTIKGLLWIDFSKTPVSYPSTSRQGINVVLDNVLQPTGFLTVVPLIFISLLWIFFVYKVVGLIGGERDS